MIVKVGIYVRINVNYLTDWAISDIHYFILAKQFLYLLGYGFYQNLTIDFKLLTRSI